MGKPAALQGDQQTVLIEGQPAARQGDCVPTCREPDRIACGASTVLICGKPAGRLADPTDWGRNVICAASSVFIGE